MTTGFGTFSNVTIPPEKLKKLQLNLIRSHATGYGEPLAPNRARMLLALRINILAKGHSGISVENIKKMIAAFNGNLQKILNVFTEKFQHSAFRMFHNREL